MKKLKQLLRREKGTAALYFAMALFILLAMGAVALDGSNAYLQRRNMQTAADAAAMAGGRVLALEGSSAEIESEVRSFALANGVGGLSWSQSEDGKSIIAPDADQAEVTWEYINDGKDINVTVANDYEPYFARILGYDTLRSSGASRAGYEPIITVDNLVPLAINGCDCLNFDSFPVAVDEDDFGEIVSGIYQIDNVKESGIDFSMNLAGIDPSFPNTNANRPYNMFYTYGDTGTFTEYGDGTARSLHWVANINGDGFLVDMTFDGRTTTIPDIDSPLCDGPCPDTSGWHYYTTVEGTLNGLPQTRFAGAVIKVTRRGAAFQVGTDAHQKNPQGSFGAAGYLSLEVLQQPNTGVTLATTIDEATNHMVLILKEEEETEPTATPTEEPTATLLPGATATETPVAPTATSAAPTATSAAPTVTPTTSGSGDCRVKYQSKNDDGDSFTGKVEIHNKTGVTFNGWTLAWSFAGDQQITSLSGASWTQSGTNVQVSSSGTVDDNKKADFTFEASYSGVNFDPINFTINGMSCTTYGATDMPAFAARPGAGNDLAAKEPVMSPLLAVATSVSLSSLNLSALHEVRVGASPLAATGLTVSALPAAPLALAPMVAAHEAPLFAPRTATPTRTPTATRTPTPTNAPMPTQAPTLTSSYCPSNLLLNPSFESGTSNWTNATGTGNHGFIIQEGTKYGYVSGSGTMYQDVTASPGSTFAVSFYSASHVPGSQTLQLQYLDASDTVLASSALHTISMDVDLSNYFGGPYSLSLSAAPAGTTKMRVAIKANNVDWAKVDAFCLTGVVPTATPTATATSIPTATATRTPTPTATSILVPTNTPTTGPTLMPTPTTVTCNLYPIALSSSTLSGATVGATLGDIWNGVQAGNFGWLTWAGSPNVPTLVTSLTPPGDSSTYVNPNDSADYWITIGDWVQGSPGVSNASNVRAALDVLETMDITVPVWDQASGTGNNSLYRVVNFAVVRITDYALPNQNRITATFLGYAPQCSQSPTPTPTATATATRTPTPAATVTATATNTSLPTATATNTVPPTATPGPEVEYCTYNLNVKVGETFNIRDYVRYKDNAYQSTPVTWSQVYFTYTGAGANDPTNPTDWNLSNFNNGVSVTMTNMDMASGTGNKGDGEYRIYLVRNGSSTYDDHMTIRVNTSSSDVEDAKCIPSTPTVTPTPTTSATSTPSSTPTPSPTPTETSTPYAVTPPPVTPPPPSDTCVLDEVAGYMDRYSLIVLNDLSTSSDVENRTFVGGSLVSSNSANFAINTNGVASTEAMLVVVGDIVAGDPLNLNAGSLRLGGSSNGRIINYNGGGSLIADNTLSNSSITSKLQSASAELASQAANNGVTIAGNAAKFAVTETTDDGVAIFQVAGADLFGGAIAQIELTPGGASTIVINVTGGSVNWVSGNMVGSFNSTNWRGNVIWNFPEATSLNLGSYNFMGALLAPYAAVTAAGNLDGAVAVKSLTTTAEVHQPTFSGNIGALCEDDGGDDGSTPCKLAWLDWDKNDGSSNSELADDINDPSRSGTWSVGDTVAAGPEVKHVQAVANALDTWLDQPMTVVLYGDGNQDDGYQVCGFAKFTMTDYDFDALPAWIQGEFRLSVDRGETDPDGEDYGLRGIRLK